MGVSSAADLAEDRLGRVANLSGVILTPDGARKPGPGHRPQATDAKGLMGVEFVAIDLETTGLFPETDRIVEVGALRFDASGAELASFASLVNPGRPMAPAAFQIHGIGDDVLAGAPGPEVVLPQLLAFLGEPGGSTLLAHNAAFDAGFLGRELARLGIALPGHRVVDTLALARGRLPDAPNHRLDTLARLLGLDPDGAHRALADCRRVLGLWRALGGDPGPDCALVAYPIFDPRRPTPAPAGWDELAVAIEGGNRVRMEYAGGTRGEAPREITPRRFLHRGGTAYVVALCHLDAHEKAFRLDRVRRFEVVVAIAAEGAP